MGPAFSTPYQERIRAARVTDKQPEAGQKTPQSEKLKHFLSIGPVQDSVGCSPRVHTPPAFRNHVNPSPSHYTPTTPTRVGNAHGPTIPQFEDSLRRMLNKNSELRTASPSAYQSS